MNVVTEIASKNISVLIVEDDEIDQRMLRRMCSDSSIIGHHQLASSLSEAREAIKNDSFDVIVSDYFLSDGEGMDLVNVEPNIPVILITGSGSEQIAVESMKAGAVDYIIKDLEGSYVKNLTISIERARKTFQQKQELSLLHSRMAEIMDNSTDLIQTTDLEGKLLFVNKCWRETLGYSNEEWVGMNVIDIIHPNSKDHCMNLLKNLAEAKAVSDEEISFVSSDGSQIFTRANILSRSDSKGIPIGTQGVFKDITASILVEKKVKEGEDRYQLLVESANDVIFHGDSNGRLLFINELGSELTGYSFKELIGVHFLKLVEEEHGKRVTDFYLDQIKTGSESSYLEFPIVRKDGSQRWVGQSIRVLTDGDSPTNLSGFLGVVRDITEERQNKEELILSKEQLEQRIIERTKSLEETNTDLKKAISKRKRVEKSLKESKEEYERLFQNAHEAIIIFRPSDEIVLEVNQRACMLYGFTSSEFVGMSLGKISRKTSSRKELIDRTISNLDYEHFEMVHHTKDKQQIILEINAVQVQFKGQPAILSMNRDVTENREMDFKLEEERKQRLTSLVDGQEIERNRIAKDLHDGLGQVLTALILSLRKIERDGKLNNRQTSALRETEDINRYLIEEIRRISSNLMPAVLKDFGLEKALRNMVGSFNSASPVLVFSCSAEFSRLDEKVEIALFRIAQEAVNNAMKYAEAEEINLTITDESNQIIMSIVDDGKGMSEPKEDAISGNGLGHMKERARLIGAELEIISSKNFGTEVVVSYQK